MNNDKPPFDKKNGIIYPLIYRIFCLGNWWLSAKIFGKSHKQIDIYILVNWLLLFSICIILFILNNLCNIWKIIISIYIIYRLVDILLILLSTLIRRTYQEKGEWSSPNRTFFLVLMNSIEVFLIFSIFYHFLGNLHFNSSNIIFFHNFLDSIYFSVITGTTLGYGDIYPVTEIAKILTIFQPITVLFLLVSMLSFSRGAYKKNKK